MSFYLIPSLEDLIESLSQLPGIGKKTAQRLALFILKSQDNFADKLVNAVINVKNNINFCGECFNLTEDEICTICSDPKRDSSKICVVEDIVDIMAVETSAEYRGLYHVLGGVISPLAGVSVEDLHIKELLGRVARGTINEIILALNLSTEGEATMIYLAQQLKRYNVEITRIAHGVPMGSHLEFVDQMTIGRAITGRQKL